MRKVLVAFFTCLSLMAKSQVTFQFIPELQGRTTDGLLWVKLISLYQQANTVMLDISVSEKKAGKIIVVTTGAFTLMPGTNAVERNAAAAAIIRFAENNLARLVRQSSFFPEGEYEYCFQVYRADKSGIRESLGEQCFDFLVEPLTPLFLIEPFLKEQTCDKRPTFTWQPSLPAIPGSQYRLTLAEIKPGQAVQEALVYNVPFINQSGINSPILLYPAASKALEEGRSYTWQITLYKDGVILNRSEIWDFTIKCNDTPVVEKADGFRDIEDLAKGNYYIANGKILFALYNVYEERKLEYSVFCLNKPDQQFKRLPKVKLQRGNNNITIDVADNNSFIDGFHYILSVRMPDNTVKKMRFTYKSPLL